MNPIELGSFAWLLCPLFFLVMVIACLAMRMRMRCGGLHDRGSAKGERSTAERPSTSH